MDEIANFDEHWDAWDQLDEECNRRRSEVRRVIDTVRTTRRIPRQEIERALGRVRRLLGEIKKAEFRDIDQEELATRATRQMAVLTFLRERSHSVIDPSSQQIRGLLDATNVPAELADRVARYESQTMLAILSKPAGNEYWQLMRSIANGVKDDRKSAASSHKLKEIEDVLNFLAPASLLYDNGHHVPGLGKWARRTTKVHGIFNAGLPGLGRRA